MVLYYILLPLAWLVFHIGFRVECVGRENLKKVQTGTASQPGRLGGESTHPLAASSGPPQAMPIPAGAGLPPSESSSSARLPSFRSISSGVPPVFIFFLPRISGFFPSPVRTASDAAHFVPPMSMPR